MAPCGARRVGSDHPFHRMASRAPMKDACRCWSGTAVAPNPGSWAVYTSRIAVPHAAYLQRPQMWRCPIAPWLTALLAPDARLAMDDTGDRQIGILVSLVEGLIRRVAGTVRLDPPDHPHHGVRRFDHVAVAAGAHGSEDRRA